MKLKWNDCASVALLLTQSYLTVERSEIENQQKLNKTKLKT